MSFLTLQGLLNQLDDIFEWDSEEEFYEIYDDLIELNQGFHEEFSDLSDGDEIHADLRQKLLKQLLLFASRLPRLVDKIDETVLHFKAEEASGEHLFTHASSGRELEQEEVETLFELSALWALVPLKLVHEHMDLVKKAAKKHQSPSRIDPELEFQDLLSVAREGLFLAAQKMFETPRAQFRNFAMQVIADKIKAHQGQKYPLPHKIKKKLMNLKEARDKTGIKTHDDDAAAGLGKALGYSPQALTDLFEIEAVWGESQLVDYGDRMEELQIADESKDALHLLIDHEADMIMSETMTRLTMMQRNVILHIYYKDQSFRETAESLGISLSVVKKHHRNAMQLLRQNLDGDDAQESQEEAY